MMKRLLALLFLLGFFSNIISQTIVSPQFSELNGIEDQQGNTHLFYRIYTSSYDSVNYWPISSDNIYHFDLSTQADSLFLKSYYGVDSIYHQPEEFVISDLTFWQNNPVYFIYGGTTEITILNEHTFIKRFDSENTYYRRGVEHVIEISNQNDSLLYAGVEVYDSSGFELTIKSIDGGWNWESVSDEYELLSLNPSNDQIFFAREEISKNLYKTTDGGSSFYLVDPSMTYWEQQYHYDPDGNHIYRIIRNFHTNDYELKISSNDGDPSSWVTKYTFTDQIFISNNSSISGEIYLAHRKNIYISTDYGNTLNLYKTLDRNIVGIYKKPNSTKLYAATKYKIFEITPDSIHVIKQLPEDDNFEWYPLSIGNLWVYENYYYENGTPQFTGYSWDLITDTLTLANGKKYFKLIRRNTNTVKDTLYLRLDSTSSIIYGYDFNSENDLLYENLGAQLGDTICYEYNPLWNCQIVQSEEDYSIWGLSTIKREIYPNQVGWICSHSLLKGIGLFTYGCGDLVGYYSNLIGCVIDGTVYGDTTVVSVEDETPNLPKEFHLSQNYPNPFNPTTIIKYSIPNVARSEASQNKIVLKVYNVLGKEIATLVNEEKPPGTYEVTFNAAGLPSGVYLYRLTTGNLSYVKKLILIK